MENTFLKLVEILDMLLGPDGCPWDQEQTLKTLRKHLLEETCEVIDAITDGNADHLSEEIGDLFLNAVFLSKLAEKEGLFHWESPLKSIIEKLIRRHPHIFGEKNKDLSADDVLAQWQEIKKLEKKETQTLMIPRELPALARTEKLLSEEKKKNGLNKTRSKLPVPDMTSEEELGAYLTDVVAMAKKRGFHAESALRHAASLIEEELLSLRIEDEKLDEIY